MGEHGPPIDILRIARAEGILLARGNYGESFDGRIEYHPKQRKFILFYPEPNSTHPMSRIRFSVAHELGHYYVPAHRTLLLEGKFHSSQAGFVSDNTLEREADFFAAALLLPSENLDDLIASRKFLTLKDILELASTWEASATCTAIRYVEYAAEACSVLLSRDGQILYYIASEDAACRGFQWLGHKRVPPRTATAAAGNQQGSGDVAECDSLSEVWFSQRRASCKLWEEAFPLGYTGLVLTMLTLELGAVDDD